jgi:hypothetical protein
MAACDRKDWEYAGYQDGYAAIIHAACKFRTSLVNVKWTMTHTQWDTVMKSMLALLR